MLVLSRRPGESIMVGDEVEIQVLEVRGQGDQAVVRLGITAPRHVPIHRKEVYDAVVQANREAAQQASIQASDLGAVLGSSSGVRQPALNPASDRESQGRESARDKA